MIAKMEISGVHTELDADLKKYIQKKIGSMDRYFPRHARKSAHAEVIIKEEKLKTKKNYTCEIILYLPNDVITTKETTINMYAAVDIVETKLKNQLKRYKDKHAVKRLPRRILDKIRSRPTG